MGHAQIMESRDEMMTALRAELKRTHKEERMKWKKDTEAKMQKIENDLKEHYETVLHMLEKQVKETTEDLKTTKDELSKQIEDGERSVAEQQRWMEKCSSAEKAYREEKQTWINEKRNYEDQLEMSRKERFEKEHQFNSLMDEKIHLDNEISEYRQLLDQEVSRVGLLGNTATTTTGVKDASSAGSKRKPIPSGEVKSSGKRPKVHAKLPDAPVRLVDFSLEQSYAILKNVSKDVVNLKGWELSGVLGEKSYTFVK